MSENRPPVTPLKNLLLSSGVRADHSSVLNSPFRSPLITHRTPNSSPACRTGLGLSRSSKARNWGLEESPKSSDVDRKVGVNTPYRNPMISHKTPDLNYKPRNRCLEESSPKTSKINSGLNTPYRNPMITNSTPSPVGDENKRTDCGIRVGLSRNFKPRNRCVFESESLKTSDVERDNEKRSSCLDVAVAVKDEDNGITQDVDGLEKIGVLSNRKNQNDEVDKLEDEENNCRDEKLIDEDLKIMEIKVKRGRRKKLVISEGGDVKKNNKSKGRKKIEEDGEDTEIAVCHDDEGKKMLDDEENSGDNFEIIPEKKKKLKLDCKDGKNLSETLLESEKKFKLDLKDSKDDKELNKTKMSVVDKINCDIVEKSKELVINLTQLDVNSLPGQNRITKTENFSSDGLMEVNTKRRRGRPTKRKPIDNALVCDEKNSRDSSAFIKEGNIFTNLEGQYIPRVNESDFIEEKNSKSQISDVNEGSNNNLSDQFGVQKNQLEIVDVKSKNKKVFQSDIKEGMNGEDVKNIKEINIQKIQENLTNDSAVSNVINITIDDEEINKFTEVTVENSGTENNKLTANEMNRSADLKITGVNNQERCNNPTISKEEKNFKAVPIKENKTHGSSIIERIDFVKDVKYVATLLPDDDDDFLTSPGMKVMKKKQSTTKGKVRRVYTDKNEDVEKTTANTKSLISKKRTSKRLLSSDEDNEEDKGCRDGNRSLKKSSSNNSFSSTGSGSGKAVKTLKRRSLSLKKSSSSTITLTDDEGDSDFAPKPNFDNRKLQRDGQSSDGWRKSIPEVAECTGTETQTAVEKLSDIVCESPTPELTVENDGVTRLEELNTFDDCDDDFQTPVKRQKRSSLVKRRSKHGFSRNASQNLETTRSKEESSNVVDVAVESRSCNEEQIDVNIQSQRVSQEIVSRESNASTTEDTEVLRDEVYNLEVSVYDKERQLEELKRTEHYKEIHNITDLNERTAVWRNGCKEALYQLLNKLRENMPTMTMRALLARLNTQPEFLDFDEENDCFK